MTALTAQNVSRSCHIDRSKVFVAVGCTAGNLTLFRLSSSSSGAEPADTSSSGSSAFSAPPLMRVEEVARRKDAKGEVTEIKFSPSNDLVRCLLSIGLHADS